MNDDVPTRIFRPEAIEAQAEPNRPRILPPISAPAVRGMSVTIASVVVVAIAVGLVWPVPRLQRVTVVGLPDARGIVVISDPDEVTRLRPGNSVNADFGGSLKLELRIDNVMGVRTPKQIQTQFPGSRLTAITSAPVGLALASVRGRQRVPGALGEAAADGTADTGRGRVIDLIARKLS